jgi:hypothetical protein
MLFPTAGRKGALPWDRFAETLSPPATFNALRAHGNNFERSPTTGRRSHKNRGNALSIDVGAPHSATGLDGERDYNSSLARVNRHLYICTVQSEGDRSVIFCPTSETDGLMIR